jgi:hypothetical protein
MKQETLSYKQFPFWNVVCGTLFKFCVEHHRSKFVCSVAVSFAVKWTIFLFSPLTIAGITAGCSVIVKFEDIGGFVGAYLFEDIESVKQNSDIMHNIFSDMKNYESGDTISTINWNNWNEE